MSLQRCLLTLYLSLVVFPLMGQQLYLDPALSPDGERLVFSTAGDLWLMHLQEGWTQRLTVHPAMDRMPCWCGTDTVVFVSYRHGNADLYALDVRTGSLHRLTYYHSNDLWPHCRKGKVVFETRRIWNEIEWENEIYVFDHLSGTPYRMMDAFGYMPRWSPSGRFVAFVKGPARIAREAYRGSAAKELWIYDTHRKTYHKVTAYEGQDYLPRWGAADTVLYYISARSGKYNVWRQRLSAEGEPAGAPLQLTDQRTWGVRHFDVQGELLAYSSGGGLYVKDLRSGETRQLHPSLIAHRTNYTTVKRKYTNKIRQYALSPNGKYIAMIVRGEVVLKLNDPDRPQTKIVLPSPSRQRQVDWVDDSTLLYLSDESGNYELYLLTKAAGESTLFDAVHYDKVQLTHTAEDEMRFWLSPNRKKIAVLQGRGRLKVYRIDIDGKSLVEGYTALDGWATPRHLSWSPDSRWMSYALHDLYFNSDIYLLKAEPGARAINVSMHPAMDYHPVWSSDGRRLYFLSNRHNRDDDVWFVWLRRSDWEKYRADLEEEERRRWLQALDKANDSIVQVDEEDIYKRQVQLSNYAGNEAELFVTDDADYVYFTVQGKPAAGKKIQRSLVKLKWDGSKAEELADGLELRSARFHTKVKKLYYLDAGGGLWSFSLGDKKRKKQAFSATLHVDVPAERAQIFHEAWRALRDGFYDPQFHGRDFAQLRDKYKPLVLGASTREEFVYLFNEMLGQLNASHMGLRLRSRGNTQEREKNGLAGVEWHWANGKYVARYVLPRGPADRSGLQVGDALVAINDVDLQKDTNIYALLHERVGEKVYLRVQRGDEAQTRAVRLVDNLRRERYEAWVERMRRWVDSLSGGRLGYIHIQAMNWQSFERFQSALMASAYGKEGVVIDVRYNGGGWTTDMLMAVLTPRQHAYTIPRGAVPSLEQHRAFREYYPYSERLIFPPLMKPSVALCNESSYSNAEIFSHAFKSLGIGPLVGTPTFGAVISTGAYDLLDDMYVRMPFRAWYVKSTGENMEQVPAVPDIVVDNPPDYKATGRDRQLKAAVEALLRIIDSAKKE